MRDNTSPPRTGVKLGYAVDRVEERTGPEDVGEQALIRGLATASPFFVWGCPRSEIGRRSMIGHMVPSGVPLPWFRPHPYTIDVSGSSPLMLTATEGLWARSSAPRLERSTAPGYVTPFEMP